MRDWTFECVVKGQADEYVPFAISYMDYDGDFIYPESGSFGDSKDKKAWNKFNERKRTADAYLVLIDGRRIYRLLRGETDERLWLHLYLQRVMSAVVEGKPVQLVVTKWDVLKRGGYDLGSVKNLLLAQPTIREFVNSQSHRNVPIRLIPVDVLGPLAKLDDDDDMIKIAGEIPRPTNLLVPLAALLPDLVKQKLLELAAASEGSDRRGFTERVKESLRAGANHPTAKALIRQAALTITKRVMTKRGKSPDAAETIIAQLFELGEDILNPLMKNEGVSKSSDEELKGRQAKIADSRKALELAVLSCKRRLERFTSEYPGSLLEAVDS